MTVPLSTVDLDYTMHLLQAQNESLHNEAKAKDIRFEALEIYSTTATIGLITTNAPITKDVLEVHNKLFSSSAPNSQPQ